VWSFVVVVVMKLRQWEIGAGAGCVVCDEGKCAAVFVLN
jgi:hypothetical protein